MPNPIIRIGLTLDGSVSAGAYIAGVVDYLLETLDAWEDAKKSGSPDAPRHQVRIEIITGASGGGITGTIATLLGFQPHFPVSPSRRWDPETLISNKLYDSWVNLTAQDMVPVLLNNSDLGKASQPVSLLNSSFIDQLAGRLITVPANPVRLRDYISPSLSLLLSLSNLEGFKYIVPFSRIGASEFAMTQHRDYACFRLGDRYLGDGWIPLNPISGEGMKELRQAAPATAAFPISLACRLFERDVRYVIDNPLLINQGLQLVEPDLKKAEPGDIYSAYFVDGGLLNNEPFDLAEMLLYKGIRKDLSPATDRHIIMIEPFPSTDPILRSDPRTKAYPFSIWSELGKVYQTARSQLGFKEDLLASASDENDYSRYLIAPRRQSANGEILDGSIAMACGALGGFSGFLDYEFRRHDFFLGRKNAQGFLRQHYCVPVGANRIVDAGYTDPSTREIYQFEDPPGSGKWWLPIIPDLKYQEVIEPDYPWPRYDIQRLEKYKGNLMGRIRSISGLFIKNSVRLAGFRFLLWLCQRKLFRRAKNLLTGELRKWQLLPTTPPSSPEQDAQSASP
jgi:hypothetical protein